MKRVTIEQLRALDQVPFEKWRDTSGIRLKAVSANSHGTVNSGILLDGRYFFRVWSPGFKTSEFVWG